mmetsp:Transcript_35528/g.62704  ORF Transcript_35528/g.62704 Transcript_35528/m.62704 type:complete len:270 (-) Transcript_35528:128-937(-)
MTVELARFTASRQISVSPEVTKLKSDVISAATSWSFSLAERGRCLRAACSGLARLSDQSERPGGLRMNPECMEGGTIASLGSLGGVPGDSSSLRPVTTVAVDGAVAAAPGAIPGGTSPRLLTEASRSMGKTSQVFWPPPRPPTCVAPNGMEESPRRASKFLRTWYSKFLGSQVPRQTSMSSLRMAFTCDCTCPTACVVADMYFACSLSCCIIASVCSACRTLISIKLPICALTSCRVTWSAKSAVKRAFGSTPGEGGINHGRPSPEATG